MPPLHCSFWYFIIAILSDTRGSTLCTRRRPCKVQQWSSPSSAARAPLSRGRSRGLPNSAAACCRVEALLGWTGQPWAFGASLRCPVAARALLPPCRQNWAVCCPQLERASTGHPLRPRKCYHLRDGAQHTYGKGDESLSHLTTTFCYTKEANLSAINA